MSMKYSILFSFILSMNRPLWRLFKTVELSDYKRLVFFPTHKGNCWPFVQLNDFNTFQTNELLETSFVHLESCRSQRYPYKASSRLTETQWFRYHPREWRFISLLIVTVFTARDSNWFVIFEKGKSQLLHFSAFLLSFEFWSDAINFW